MSTLQERIPGRVAAEKHIMEELKIIKEVLFVGNTTMQNSAEYGRGFLNGKILAAQTLIDALLDELAPIDDPAINRETEDDFDEIRL